MMVSSYDFGEIVIDGAAYSSDVIIHPDRVQDSWWRKEGHALHPDDLEGVWPSGPDHLVVGTGYFGRMTIPKETRAFISRKGVTLYAAPTAEAVALFNRLSSEPGGRVVAALHLTC